MFPLIVLLSIQLFGIQVGAELTVPPCPADPTLITAVCVEPVDNSTGWRYVVFPPNHRPTIMATDKLGVFVIDGKVEELEFITYGPRTQFNDLGTLKTWFGEPESVTAGPNLGESFDTIRAGWNKPDLRVWFRGNLGGKNGIVTIHTAKVQKLKS